ncbi:hypothetical protein FI604_09985 [Campylobacter coli]|nr:hypothetical protein [Campylobacter coli]EBF6040759.1 hypothetical protein [Campylobacter coli]
MQPKSIILFFYGYILFFRRQNTTSKNTNFKILDDEYWLFAYEVLSREDPSALNKCKDWKQIKNSNISFIRQEFQ